MISYSISNLQNEKVSRIVGELISDGHIQLDKRYLISFYSKHRTMIDDFNKRFTSFFPVKAWVYQDRGRYKTYFKSKNACDLLLELGVLYGNKTNTPFLVPKWIQKGNNTIKSSFVSALFDCEGYIYATKSRKKLRWRIGIEFYKNINIYVSGEQFLNQVRNILIDFQIKCSPIRSKKGKVRKDGTMSKGVRFEIERSSFDNFYKYVNFHHELKRGKLIKALLP